jgi:hypothetical protein
VNIIKVKNFGNVYLILIVCVDEAGGLDGSFLIGEGVYENHCVSEGVV